MAEIRLFSRGWQLYDGTKIRKWNKKKNIIDAARLRLAVPDQQIWQIDSSISLSKGKDVLKANYFQLKSLDLGKGQDLIESSSSIRLGNSGYAYVDMGEDSDKVISKGYIWIDPGSYLDLGNGDDTLDISSIFSNNSTIGLQLSGELRGGDGNDSIKSTISGRSGAISMSGVIDLGVGNDTLTGLSNSGYDIYMGEGSRIYMGDGDDLVDCITGGVFLGGIVDLGSGNDKIYLNINKSDFNGGPEDRGKFMGGDGTDTLYLPEGYYKITYDTGGNNVYKFNFDNGKVFLVSGFERLGNALTGASSDLREGNVYVIDGGLFLRNQDGDFFSY